MTTSDITRSPQPPLRPRRQPRGLRPGASLGRRFGLLAALALGATLLMAACTGGGDDDEAAGSDASPAATEATASAPAATATEAMTPTEEATEEATPTATEAADGEGGAPTVAVATEGELAPYLVGPDGMTLYLFTNDEPGVSNCTGGCIGSWPPLTVPEGTDPVAGEGVTGELGVIERADGLGRQVTYNGMPLYYWAADQQPGDTTGHGVGDVWFVVPPDAGGSASSQSDGGSTQTSGSSGIPGY